MTRELVEKAKAVCDLVEAQGGHGLRVHALVDELRAAVRAAEAAPVADEERVREAASEALAALFNSNDATPDGQQRLVSDAIRPYITPDLVADTVAVPVARLKQWLKRINLMPFRNELQPTIAEITALLPPPPAPEPSAELVETWKLEAAAAMEHVDLIRERIMFQQGYVARARAEWAKKGGG